MGRPATSLPARIRLFEAAKAKAAKLKRGTTLSFEPMMLLIGVSRPVLRDWCNELPGFAESGAFTPGGLGIEWEFKPVQTVNFLLKHFETQRAASAKRTNRIRKIIGAGSLDGVPDDIGTDELAKIIRLSTDLQNAKVQSGQLIDAGKAATAIREFFIRVQQAVLRSAQEQDPTGTWSPEMRESFEDATRSILLAVEQAGQDCLSALRGGTA